MLPGSCLRAGGCLHSLLVLSDFTKEVTCKLGSTTCSTKAGSQLTSYHWNTPKHFRPQSLLSGSLSPPRQLWPHQTPSASNPCCWKDLGFSSQLTSDMWLTILSFQNSEAKPSANKVIAGPTPASLIEICLLQNVWTSRAGCLAGSGAGQSKKFRERQKTTTSQRRTERGYKLIEAKCRYVGREGRRGIIPLILGNIMQYKAESILIFTTQSIP